MKLLQTIDGCEGGSIEIWLDRDGAVIVDIGGFDVRLGFAEVQQLKDALRMPGAWADALHRGRKMPLFRDGRRLKLSKPYE